MNSFLKGFMSIFDWMCPRTLDEKLQDLYDDMGWGKYQNPIEEYAKMSDWVVVKDLDVRHLYRCPECGAELYVYPDFFEAMGTPVCCEPIGTCDCDMDYVRTEVKNV
jgi:hypothetical protein